MAIIFENVRKITTFLLAAFLWLHALFFLDFQSIFISRCTQLLRLTASEVVLFALLVIFSFVTGSGFWKTLVSLIYIYAFPFVLLWYACYWCFLILRALNRWFKAQSNSQLRSVPVEVQDSSTIALVPTASSDDQVGAKKRTIELLQFLLRPLQRFTFLWCVILLITTHVGVVWLSLVVVLLHLARKIFGILKILLFSDPWLRKIGTALLQSIETVLDGLDAVTPEAAPNNELKSLWNQVSFWRKIIDFLTDQYLISRWAWVLGVIFLGSIYTYIAVLFSFAYYGIARVSGVSYSWPEALVTSLFILIFVKELPKILALKALAGVHWFLVFTIGIGTIVNFFRRRLDSIRAAAVGLSDRLADEKIREKYLILEAKFSAPTNTPSVPTPEN